MAYGPYIRHKYRENWDIGGFLLYGRPDFTIDGTSFRSDAFAIGVGATGAHVIGNVDVTSYLSMVGTTEGLPAITIGGVAIAERRQTSVTGNFGARAHFNRGQEMRPYLSLGGAFSRIDDGISDAITHFTPTLGAGLNIETELGALSLDLSASEITEGTRAVSVGFTFAAQF